MLRVVDVGRLGLRSYRDLAPEGILDEVERCAEGLRGARVLHINATPYGGGVSELLRSTVPLLNDLGLVAEWQVISGDEDFFAATKAIHNALQGAERGLTERERGAYLASARRNAELLGDQRYDFVFVHDPQPVPLPQLGGKGDGRWVWRCHIDTARPNPAVWSFVRQFLGDYDAAIFTMQEFVPPDFPLERVEAMPPAIDPLSPKNMPLPDGVSRQMLSWLGIEPDRPLISQISRFDPWKDPLGVIAAFRLAREQVPELQLVLAGSMALDDPEGWEVYGKIGAEAGRAGGIPLQMADGTGGRLVEDVEGCAAALLELLGSRERARALAEAGRERVREHFLLPRLLLNELTLMLELARERPISPAPLAAGAHRDPVCGMAVEAAPATPRTSVGAREYLFCSEACLARFRADPDRYLR